MLTLALDVIKTLGFFVLFGIEFNLTAVTALLALIGYSVNDKVVVFGIVVGTSSSIFIAAPLVLMFGERALRNEKQEAEKLAASGEESLFLREDRP